MDNWDIYRHTYSQGKCGICGAEGEVTITDSISRCGKCHLAWLMKNATE